ncbi:MAG: hypothetical protein AAGB10_22940, partial [Pseudomonadota bacterium]
CRECDLCKDHFGALVMAGFTMLPIREPTGQDCDAVSSFVTAIVVFRRRLALIATRIAGAYPFVFQCFLKLLVGKYPVAKTPIDLWQAACKRSCANVITDLTRG